MATDSLWVFGYGSLVSPVSMAHTIDRVVKPRDRWPAALDWCKRDFRCTEVAPGPRPRPSKSGTLDTCLLPN